MDREELIRAVRGRIAGRRLVYFGTRGDDVEGVSDLPELSTVFSVISPYRRRTSVRAVALEELTGRRVDLDVHDIDDELGSPSVRELRRALLRSLAHDSVVFTYRPTTFLSSICFARRDSVHYAGMFKDHQTAFEHKPWVESAVADLGVPTIPWTYVADEEQVETLSILSDGPVLVRTSRSSGGTGLLRLDRAEDLGTVWPHQPESFASVAPYFADGIPANVSGVVWGDGVTLHHPTVQLIGIPGLTNRPFGYCGNDFGAVARLREDTLVQMERGVRRIGAWMQSRGFRGAFGVDFLVVDGAALFTEVNPRFQGVTHASCQVSVEAGRSCVMLEHLAALLDLPAPPSASILELADQAGDLAHLVLHRLDSVPGRHDPATILEPFDDRSRIIRDDVMCSSDLIVDPGATIARLTVRDRVTEDGRSLTDGWKMRVDAAHRALETPLS